MPELEILINDQLSLIEEAINYLKTLPIEQRMKPVHIGTLCRLTNSLLAIQKQYKHDVRITSKLSDEELDQQLFEQIKELQAKGFKFPEGEE
jgi:hypothetical protein